MAAAEAKAKAAEAPAALAKVTLTKKTKSAKKGKVTVAWNKVDGATGYEVKVGAKTYTVKKASTLKKTVKAAKGKKVKVKKQAARGTLFASSQVCLHPRRRTALEETLVLAMGPASLGVGPLAIAIAITFPVANRLTTGQVTVLQKEADEVRSTWFAHDPVFVQ